jgi:hypothetical protein
MARFFFHLKESNSVVRDEEGRELPDLSAAHAVAVMSARSILCDELMTGRISLDGAIEVQDERGAPLETVRFSDAVKIDQSAMEPEYS